MFKRIVGGVFKANICTLSDFDAEIETKKN